MGIWEADEPHSQGLGHHCGRGPGLSPTPPLQFSKLWPQLHCANWEHTQLILNLFPLLGTTSPFHPSCLFQWKWTDLVIEVSQELPKH